MFVPTSASLHHATAKAASKPLPTLPCDPLGARARAPIGDLSTEPKAIGPPDLAKDTARGIDAAWIYCVGGVALATHVASEERGTNGPIATGVLLRDGGDGSRSSAAITAKHVLGTLHALAPSAGASIVVGDLAIPSADLHGVATVHASPEAEAATASTAKAAPRSFADPAALKGLISAMQSLFPDLGKEDELSKLVAALQSVLQGDKDLGEAGDLIAAMFAALHHDEDRGDLAKLLAKLLAALAG